MKYDLAVFIGRFQPFHNGHLDVIRQALNIANKVLILVGSSDRLPDYRNPFTFEQRCKMIWNSVNDELLFDKPYATSTVLSIEPLVDSPYSDIQWINNVNELIQKYTTKDSKVVLVGHSKDQTSYYLKLFPNFDSFDVKGLNYDGSLLDATYIRKKFFSDKLLNDYYLSKQRKGISTNFIAACIEPLKKMIPQGTADVLSSFILEGNYENITEEISHIEKYKKQWENSPYPPVFVTVDAVVVQAGYVLLIERKERPGKGQFALPGGFINQYEHLEHAVLRELNEETSLDVPPAILKNKMKGPLHFAYPHRSSRGRTITFAYYFNLDSELERKKSRKGSALGMTKIKGGDDAAKAFWFPISELKRDMLFEDHYDIIMKMIEDIN